MRPVSRNAVNLSAANVMLSHKGKHKAKDRKRKSALPLSVFYVSAFYLMGAVVDRGVEVAVFE